ncbi:MAG: transglycosylase SLT domain-containing protein [Thermomicrobiales bacterium]
MDTNNVRSVTDRGQWRGARRRVLWLAALGTGFVSAPGVLAGKKSKCRNNYSEKEILDFIRKAAKKYKQSRKAMERVARCESNLDPCAVNKRGPYFGLFQFLKSTWKTTPYGNRDIFDPEAQALAAAWMWKQGRKNEWACK